jgi:predicted O-methyltransferase YrrM
MPASVQATQLRFDTAADLRRSKDPVARRLAQAVDAPSPAEPNKAHLDRIEELRDRLLADDTQVEILNFGAGSNTDSRTQEEMDAGWVTHNTVADVCRRAASKRRKALMLYSLVREFAPSRGVELGTCLGVSTAYMATAMRLSGHGTLVTLEGAPSFGEIARRNFAELGLSNVEVRVGRFKDTLPRLLAEAPLDFAYIDGHHDEIATLGYHRQILPHLTPGALLVFDDIAWSPGMARAWDSIAAHPSNSVSANLGRYGACVVGRC